MSFVSNTEFELSKYESEKARTYHEVSKATWLLLRQVTRFHLWQQMQLQLAAWDSLIRIPHATHPITPTFVDTTTGVRYSDMDNETIASILKLNLK